ncbi:hypothetical protein K9L16_03495 [Candidatus Pacearchaeota archaeon]|nr:hypothetical protein [Candidatus Pacearchaeota archaeon]
MADRKIFPELRTITEIEGRILRKFIDVKLYDFGKIYTRKQIKEDHRLKKGNETRFQAEYYLPTTDIEKVEKFGGKPVFSRADNENDAVLGLAEKLSDLYVQYGCRVEDGDSLTEDEELQLAHLRSIII